MRKRLLVHAAGLNLGLLMRTLVGVGTPRGLQGRAAALFAALWSLLWHPATAFTLIWSRRQVRIRQSQWTVGERHEVNAA